jgi:hypothetical protein
MDQRVASWTEIFSESWISRSSPEEAMRVLQQLVSSAQSLLEFRNCSKKQGGEKLFSAFCWLDSEKWLEVGFELLWFGWFGVFEVVWSCPGSLASI